MDNPSVRQCIEEDEMKKFEEEIILTPGGVMYLAFTGLTVSGDKPKMLKEANQPPEWKEWERAIYIKLYQLKEIGTWKLIKKTPDTIPIANKWVLVQKYNKQGELVKYKARLVAKGAHSDWDLITMRHFVGNIWFTLSGLSMPIMLPYGYDTSWLRQIAL